MQKPKAELSLKFYTLYDKICRRGQAGAENETPPALNALQELCPRARCGRAAHRRRGGNGPRTAACPPCKRVRAGGETAGAKKDPRASPSGCAPAREPVTA